jgi:hypothetical protein
MVAANNSTGAPEVLFELQPVQLVSMAAEPGEIMKVPLDALLTDVPPPQPANRSDKKTTGAESRRRTAELERRGRISAAAPPSARPGLVSRLFSVNFLMPSKNADALKVVYR